MGGRDLLKIEIQTTEMSGHSGVRWGRVERVGCVHLVKIADLLAEQQFGAFPNWEPP